ncbi:hypothetical protein ACNKHO_15205 [Shigella flexneri]
MVYTAFSEAVVKGIWHRGGRRIAAVYCGGEHRSAGHCHPGLTFSWPGNAVQKADEITIVFCGSKK